MEQSSRIADLVDKLQAWLDALVVALPNAAAALLILLVALLIARGVRKALTRLLGRFSSHEQVNRLFATLGYVAVVGTGIFIALGVLGLSKTVTTLLAGVGILGLALGFAFQDIAENFIAGVMMAFRRPIQFGDLIETNGHFGTVEDVNLRTTVLRTLDGKHVIVPNSEVIQNVVVNLSRTPDLRVDIACGVAYGDDLETAERIALEALQDVPGRDTTRDVELYYDSFGDSSINFTARFWIQYSRHIDFLSARSEAIKRLKKSFDEGGITIPFPIRTLDFGVAGGVGLDEVIGSVPAQLGNQEVE